MFCIVLLMLSILTVGSLFLLVCKLFVVLFDFDFLQKLKML